MAELRNDFCQCRNPHHISIVTSRAPTGILLPSRSSSAEKTSSLLLASRPRWELVRTLLPPTLPTSLTPDRHNSFPSYPQPNSIFPIPFKTSCESKLRPLRLRACLTDRRRRVLPHGAVSSLGACPQIECASLSPGLEYEKLMNSNPAALIAFSNSNKKEDGGRKSSAYRTTKRPRSAAHGSH